MPKYGIIGKYDFCAVERFETMFYARSNTMSCGTTHLRKHKAGFNDQNNLKYNTKSQNIDYNLTRKNNTLTTKTSTANT